MCFCRVPHLLLSCLTGCLAVYIAVNVGFVVVRFLWPSPAMSSSLLQIFETYQKARVQFVQQVAEAATRPQNIDVMQNAGVMQLLRPLLLDNVSNEHLVLSAVSATLRFVPCFRVLGAKHSTDRCSGAWSSCQL
jgi:hypothetical protein